MERENYTQDELERMCSLRDILFTSLCKLRDEADRLSAEVIRMNKILEAHQDEEGELHAMPNAKKGQPLAIHKNYIIQGLKDDTHKSANTELIEELGCSSPQEAVDKLEEFPGDWIIRGQLLSHDDPDLPENLRKKD